MDMRQGPHKNRSRNRGRRPTNQSGRVYESNGPDVKVRGTAQTVADKYLQLARDAHSAGDTVMAEGYFQHAEHYLRIVAASQPFPQHNPPQRRDDYSYDDEDGDDEQPSPVASGYANGGAANGEAHRQPQTQSEPQPQSQPQPQSPRRAPAPSTSDAETGEQPTEQQPWGGPEPEFLRRGPGNGAGRTRRTRQPRGGNGRGDAASPGEAVEESAPQERQEEPIGGRDTPEQA